MNKEIILECPMCGHKLRKFKNSEEYKYFIMQYIENNGSDMEECSWCEKRFSMIQNLIEEDEWWCDGE